MAQHLQLQWRVKTRASVPAYEWLDCGQWAWCREVGPTTDVKAVAAEMVAQWKHGYTATDEEQRVVLRTTTTTNEEILL